MQQMFGALGGGRLLEGLTIGLLMSVVVIFLLLTAYFQSVRLALASVSTVPAVIAGASVTAAGHGHDAQHPVVRRPDHGHRRGHRQRHLADHFCRAFRRQGHEAGVAAVEAAQRRLRPLLMTSFAMIAGMMPMALGLGEGGEQTAPLGRAVVGGLIGSMTAKLFVLPSVFAVSWAAAAPLPRRSTRMIPASQYHDDPDESPDLIEVNHAFRTTTQSLLVVAIHWRTQLFGWRTGVVAAFAGRGGRVSTIGKRFAGAADRSNRRAASRSSSPSEKPSAARSGSPASSRPSNERRSWPRFPATF